MANFLAGLMSRVPVWPAVLVVAICGVFMAPAVRADNLNVFVGSHLGAGETGLAAVEYTLPFIAELGLFSEWSRNSSVPENRYTVGLLARTTLPWLNFFVDTRLGYGWSSTLGTTSGGSGFDFEFGGGYRFTFDKFDLLPRVGLHVMTGPSDVPIANLSLGMAIPL